MIKYELISFLQYLITYFQFYSSITNLNNDLLIISLILFGTQYFCVCLKLDNAGILSLFKPKTNKMK